MLKTFLKGIIVFVLLSAAYFIYMGVTNKDGEIITKVEIEAASDVVYSFISEADKAKLWIAGLSSVELISGEEMEVGSSYRMVFEYNGKQMSMTETVTDSKENQQFGFDLTSDFVNSHIDISFEESDGKTIVTETNTYSGNNFLARAMTGITKKSTKVRQQAMYDKLKEVVEEEGG